MIQISRETFERFADMRLGADTYWLTETDQGNVIVYGEDEEGYTVGFESPSGGSVNAVAVNRDNLPEAKQMLETYLADTHNEVLQ